MLSRDVLVATAASTSFDVVNRDARRLSQIQVPPKFMSNVLANFVAINKMPSKVREYKIDVLHDGESKDWNKTNKKAAILAAETQIMQAFKKIGHENKCWSSDWHSLIWAVPEEDAQSTKTKTQFMTVSFITASGNSLNVQISLNYSRMLEEIGRAHV